MSSIPSSSQPQKGSEPQDPASQGSASSIEKVKQVSALIFKDPSSLPRSQSLDSLSTWDSSKHPPRSPSLGSFTSFHSAEDGDITSPPSSRSTSSKSTNSSSEGPPVENLIERELEAIFATARDSIAEETRIFDALSDIFTRFDKQIAEATDKEGLVHQLDWLANRVQGLINTMPEERKNSAFANALLDHGKFLTDSAAKLRTWQEDTALDDLKTGCLSIRTTVLDYNNLSLGPILQNLKLETLDEAILQAAQDRAEPAKQFITQARERLEAFDPKFQSASSFEEAHAIYRELAGDIEAALNDPAIPAAFRGNIESYLINELKEQTSQLEAIKNLESGAPTLEYVKSCARFGQDAQDTLNVLYQRAEGFANGLLSNIKFDIKEQISQQLQERAEMGRDIL